MISPNNITGSKLLKAPSLFTFMVYKVPNAWSAGCPRSERIGVGLRRCMSQHTSSARAAPDVASSPGLHRTQTADCVFSAPSHWMKKFLHKSLAGNMKPRYYFFLGNDVTTFHRGHSSAGRAPA
ncbi:MAG TPA: hypothetical protein VF513_10630, partial [Stenotrophomonas sp.]